MSYEAVVVGVDGVLVHPLPSETRRTAVAAAFRTLGAEPDAAAVDAVVRGTVGHVRAACDRLGVDPATFWSKREAYAAAVRRTAMLDGRTPLYDDVRPTLDALDAPVGLATDAGAATVDHALDVFGLSDRVDAAVGRRPTLDAYARCAPDPYRIDRALDALGTRNALAVAGDNASLVAAERAGVDAAFVRRPHRVGYELTADPTYELDSLADLPAVAGAGTPSGSVADRPDLNPNPNRIA